MNELLKIRISSTAKSLMKVHRVTIEMPEVKEKSGPVTKEDQELPGGLSVWTRKSYRIMTALRTMRKVGKLK